MMEKDEALTEAVDAAQRIWTETRRTERWQALKEQVMRTVRTKMIQLIDGWEVRFYPTPKQVELIERIEGEIAELTEKEKP